MEVRFEINAITAFGEEVSVVGSQDVFGEWDPHRSVPMSTGPTIYPMWVSDWVKIDVNQPKEFKFIVKKSRGIVVWEQNVNRFIPDIITNNRVILKCGIFDQGESSEVKALIEERAKTPNNDDTTVTIASFKSGLISSTTCGSEDIILSTSSSVTHFYDDVKCIECDDDGEYETMEEVAEKIASNTINYFNTLSIDDDVAVWRVSESIEEGKSIDKRPISIELPSGMISQLETLSDEFDDYCLTPMSQKGFYRHVRHLNSFNSAELGAWDVANACGHSCHEQAPQIIEIGKKLVRWCAQCCGKIIETPPDSPVKKEK